MKNLILVIGNRGFHAFYLSVYFKITEKYRFIQAVFD